MVKEVLVQLGSKVSEGVVLIKVETGAGAPAAAPAPQAAAPAPAAPLAPVSAPAAPSTATAAPPAPAALAPALPLGAKVHASPSVRAYARELGVDLSKVLATGPKGRIVKEDLTKYVKGVMSGAISGPVASAGGGISGGGTLDLLPWPKVDFSKFGEVEVKPLSRIKKISGQNLSRNWVMIPAVTYHEDADITDLEAFRVQLNKENEKSGNKLTMLAFLIKACVRAMQRFPEFNASLEHEEEGAQHFVSQSDDGSFVATANDQQLELGLERRSGVTGGVGELTEESADVGIALADASRLALSRRLIVAGAHADPGSQAVWGAEDAHVATDFDQQHGRADDVDTRQGLQQGQCIVLARQLSEQSRVETGDARFQFLDMPQQFVENEHMARGQFALEGIVQFLAASLETSTGEIEHLVRSLAVEDALDHGPCRLTMDVTDDHPQADTCIGEHFVHAVLLGGEQVDQLLALPGNHP